MGQSEAGGDVWMTVLKDEQRQIMENTRLGSKIVVHSLVLPDRASLPFQRGLFDERKAFPTNVVRVVSVEEQDERVPCSSACRLLVSFEYTQCTLKEQGTLHEEKGLYVLHEALKGFKFLFGWLGFAFPVTRGMVGLTQQEEVKVWLNEDFVRNSPQINFKRISELQMIVNIIQVCASSTIDLQFSKDFLDFFWSFQRQVVSFQASIAAIEQFALQSTNQHEHLCHLPNQLSTMTRLGWPSSEHSADSRPTKDVIGASRNITHSIQPVNLQHRFEPFQCRGLNYHY